MESNKNIKVYGTLVNHTLNPDFSDVQHNDAVVNAYLVYDGLFNVEGLLPVEKYQDVINRRVSAITYAHDGFGGVTTIENADHFAGNPYMLVVNGNTNLNGNVNVTGILTATEIAVTDLTVNNDLTVLGDTDLQDVHINGNLIVDGTSQFNDIINCVGINSTGDVIAPNITQLRADVDNILNQLSLIQSDINMLKGLWHKETISNVDYVVSGPANGAELPVKANKYFDDDPDIQND